ncbi:RHS repeat-associated core domain-containing protein [Pseudomonas izuensis]|uniref:RHS repeat-associated core domain-containing protein n=1 Tax=Pseudomonas izuensis TaxID=2684212 RepID=UPI00135694A2|nr:RHS repeat-associated core domain-containing protein [Pseudomonas izuensis]
MLATDDKHSVLSEVSEAGSKGSVYTVYGFDTSTQRGLGYNGELRNNPTGNYMLGKGYRMFDTQLMRFQSPDGDRWSPFGEGGLNRYAYVSGDPVKFKDDSGHARWAKLFAVLMMASDSSPDTARVVSKGAQAGNISDELLERGFVTYTGSDVTTPTSSAAIQQPTLTGTGRTLTASPALRGQSAQSFGSSSTSSAVPSASRSVSGGRSAASNVDVASSKSKTPKAPKAQPAPPKQLTKEQFKKMSSIMRNDYLAKGGVDPTQRGFHSAPKKTALDVRNPPRDRFN